MKEKKDLLKWVVIYLTVFLLVTPVITNVGGNDPSSLSRDDYFTILENLPHFLNDTILDGQCRVVVTPDGTPPDDMAPDQYDYCISYEEENLISENARQKFISQYNIDPYPPENDNETLAYNEYLNSIPYQPSSQYNGPHEMFGMIVTKVVTASNLRDKPLNPSGCGLATKLGFNKFHPRFQITTITYYYYGYWNAADVTTEKIKDYWNDLIEDCGWLKTYDNQVIYGWIRNTKDSTGYASGFYACSKERTNFPLKGVAQHEISHCYGAPDHGWWSWPPCVMTYSWLWLGITDWCESCHNTIYDHIWNY